VIPVSSYTMPVPTPFPNTELTTISPDEPDPTNPFDPAHPDNVVLASLLVDSQAPDGGYGWVVVLACSMLTFWFVGTTYSWGILQAALVDQQLSGPSTLAFIGSLTAACISILALVNARMIRAMGARNTALLGVALLGLGGVLSGSLTRNLGGLFATAGIVEGIGTRYSPFSAS
jgi:hypothetical protein